MVVVVVAVSGGGVGTYWVADGCRRHVIVVVEVAGDVVVRDLLSGFWTSSSCPCGSHQSPVVTIAVTSGDLPGDHTMVVVDVVVVTDERTCREHCCCVLVVVIVISDDSGGGGRGDLPQTSPSLCPGGNWDRGSHQW